MGAWVAPAYGWGAERRQIGLGGLSRAGVRVRGEIGAQRRTCVR
nr:MAG TPA: hypothetical protein [Caudoviricetes sp.]